jgi:hypothetical protein
VSEGQSQSIIWDTVVNRLASRKYRSGRAVAVWMYRPPPGGRGVAERPLTLGTFYSADGAKGISVEDARTAARAAAGKLALGLDPANDVREARRAAKSRLSVLLDDGGSYQQHLEEREICNRRSVLTTLRRYLSRLMDRDVAGVRALRRVTGIEDFRMHLLRKSVRTIMSRCGVSRTTARLAIGHQHEDQQDRAYDHHDHWEERVRAFETVAAYIERPTNNDTSVATTDALAA